MGRGVSAAAVMGQIRSAVRAYAHLGLHPEEVLACVDGLVGDLGNDQIVTCVYAVFDPVSLTLRFANAGHLPPLLATPDGQTRRLGGQADPPLGVGFGDPHRHEEPLAPGSTVLLYTDGLVERRGEDLDAGITALEGLLGRLTGPLDEAPEKLVRARLPEGQDDDVAVLVARVELGERRSG
jgi:serine phosphatase RsbU (regulator of sigma subunit)